MPRRRQQGVGPRQNALERGRHLCARRRGAICASYSMGPAATAVRHSHAELMDTTLPEPDTSAAVDTMSADTLN